MIVLVADHASITQLDVPTGIMGDIRIVCDKDNGPAFGMKFLKQD